jgi:hypothetical protein
VATFGTVTGCGMPDDTATQPPAKYRNMLIYWEIKQIK